jgi:hypothetical protein
VGRALAALVVVAGLLTCAPARGATRSLPPVARLSVSPARVSYLGGRVSFAWSSARAMTCVLSARPRFWPRRKSARVPCHGRLSRTLRPASHARRWTFTFRARNARGQVAVVKRRFVLRAPPFLVSANWSGYVVPSSTLVTEVSGEFTVPKLDCRRTPESGVSMWVGIGGVGGSSGNLLQTGVRSNCILGSQDVNPGWWAEFPAFRETTFDSTVVSAGDSVRATVSRNSDGSWTTRLDDLSTGISGVMTTGGSYGTVRDSSPTVWLDREGSASRVSYASGYTAEWILEDFYQGNGRLATLADFGSTAFTGVSTSIPSWGLTTAEQVGIGDFGGRLWAAPSGPDSSGRGFSISYTG